MNRSTVLIPSPLQPHHINCILYREDGTFCLQELQDKEIITNTNTNTNATTNITNSNTTNITIVLIILI